MEPTEKDNRKHRILGRIIKIVKKRAKANPITDEEAMNKFNVEEETEIPLKDLKTFWHNNEDEILHVCNTLYFDDVLSVEYNSILVSSSNLEAIRQYYHGKKYKERSEFWSLSGIGIVVGIAAAIATVAVGVLQVRSNRDQERIESLQHRNESLQQQLDFANQKNHELQNLRDLKTDTVIKLNPQ